MPSLHRIPVTSFLLKQTRKDSYSIISQNKFHTIEIQRDMSGPSKLGRALTLVFLVSLVALLAELLFVLWRRRLLRLQDPPEIDQSGLTSNNSSSNEQFLYFFCLKSQSRVEPAGAGEVGGPDGSLVDDPMEVIDVFKLRDMHGPSRVLFTIKEEEREDLESEKSLSSSASNKTRTRNLSECLEDTATSPELVVAIDEEGDIEATPFSTPCASPLYFTPSASPLQELGREACADEMVL